MSINKIYDPAEVEEKWYNTWMENHLFRSKPSDKLPYTVVIPPPNVTGVLHMGHMLNNTIQDILVRKARMEGKEACWVPGTDHASIATEARVVAMLKEKGIHKKDLSREDFLKHAWEWKEKYGGIILDQLKKLGASCDWERTRFTMEESLSEAVLEVFVRLYEKGLIYRGIRMVNWDPAGKTALSDEEVNHKEVQSKLYYVRYRIAGSEDFITVATTRPETILGDTAICVNPEDERYAHLVGQKVIVPFVKREIPVISDAYVDKEFGTGCLKVTPAHDLNDYRLGLTHKLEVIDVLNEDGTLNANGGQYAGLDRFVVRKKIAKDLEEAGLLAEVKDITNKVGYSERTDAVVEPRISMQWFCKMQDLAQPALDAVTGGEIKLYPPKFVNLYRTWMENVHDWCISRQLWWGQRIPAWYSPNGDFVVAVSEEYAIAQFMARGRNFKPGELRQDEDVLDTWFSSWLWPISVFDGFKDPDNPDIKYYYPTNDLVTAPEILFFWVARMIMAGYEFTGKPPFRNVYLTGIVRDKQGRKMSKSLGNSPDPIELMKKYGADGVRVGMLFSSPAGNDLLFDEKLCEQGRNFSNKIWNAFRLVQGWKTADTAIPSQNSTAVSWMRNRINKAVLETNELYEKFRISDVLHVVYKLVWDDFCSWYLEMVKPGFEQPIDRKTYEHTVLLFEDILKLLHPFMPFISEEIYSQLSGRKTGEFLMMATYPVSASADDTLLEQASIAFDVVTQVRNFRSNRQLSPKIPLKLLVNTQNQSVHWEHIDKLLGGIIVKLANLEEIQTLNAPNNIGSSFIIKGIEFSIPLEGWQDDKSNLEELRKELAYTRGFLKSVEAKLGNERFVSNAKPEIIDTERRKKADAEARIVLLEKAIGQG